MSTHGTIAIRRIQNGKDEVFVFHTTHDGYCVEDFMKKHKKPTSIDELVLEAIRFSTVFEGRDGFSGYSDSPSVNIYAEKFKKTKKYHDITEYSVYYDGTSWKHNIEKEE